MRASEEAVPREGAELPERWALYYEERVKMFAPLGFVPGISPAQVDAASRRGGWGTAGVPTVEHSPRPARGSRGRRRSWWPI
jgi:hypothetical protein